MTKIVLRTCTKCRGTGTVFVVRGLIHDKETCPRCKGSGTQEIEVEVV